MAQSLRLLGTPSSLSPVPYAFPVYTVYAMQQHPNLGRELVRFCLSQLMNKEPCSCIRFQRVRHEAQKKKANARFRVGPRPGGRPCNPVSFYLVHQRLLLCVVPPSPDSYSHFSIALVLLRR